ncbi:MAG: lysophospholipid acyltransferase family protein [Bacteroidia bacterium]
MKELISRSDFANALKLQKLKLKAVAPAIMHLLKLDKLNSLYDKNSELSGLDFAGAILEQLNIKYNISESDIKNIPETGSFIAIANHPYGGIDGLILLQILAKKRPDIKILANFLLSKIEPISPFIINVNPFENIGSRQMNITAAKTVLKHIKDAPIGIFPAGEVSALKLNNFKISDKKWQPGVGKLIKNAGVPVLPVYFSGNNSLAFNLLGLINPSLRTLKLPSELFNKSHTIQVRIGKPIKFETIQDFNSNTIIEYLRAKTYALGETVQTQKSILKKLKPLKKPRPVVDAIDTALLVEEVEKLRNNNKLLCEHNEFEVYISSASAIPNIVKEIGRLREITFRAVGEGTNRSIDLDEFDKYYKHLFVWDKQKEAIAGAYRIGEGDVLFKAFGAKGFYTSQLFNIKKRFYPVLYNSIELGRSFIDINYQRKPYSLMLLWKGINIYLQQNSDRFKYMFGPVSISNSYSKLSIELIVNYLLEHHKNNLLCNHVEPKTPYKDKSKLEGKNLIKEKSAKTIKELDALIEEIEGNNMKVPVLIKKYLSLNGNFLCFNVDKNFNDSVDGFLVVEIDKIPKNAFEMVSR